LLKKIRSFRKITLALSLLLALTVVGIGGAALAGTFTVHTATLQGTVVEAFTVTGSTDGGNGYWAPTTGVNTSGLWTVEGIIGNTYTLHLVITSISSVPLNAIVGITPGCDGVTGEGTFLVPALGDYHQDIVWKVANGSTLGLCTSNITISR
jgi:hypothetical protein